MENEGTTEKRIELLGSIIKTCIDMAKPLTYDSEDIQAPYMFSLYSIIVELSGDSHQAVKDRKELSSHILTRALLEAVVDLCNVIKNPDYVNIRFQKALIERKRKLTYLLNKEPDLLTKAGHAPEYVGEVLSKIEKLHNTEIDNPNVRKRFKDAGMEGYYDTAYALLCDYSHHDTSAIINRCIGLNVHPLEEKGILMLTDLIADLLLKASIAVHEFLKSDQIKALENLEQKWKLG